MLNILRNPVHKLLMATLAPASPKLLALKICELPVNVQAPFCLVRQLSRHRHVDEVFTSTIGLLLVIDRLRNPLILVKLKLLLRKKKLSFLSLYRLIVCARQWVNELPRPTL